MKRFNCILALWLLILTGFCVSDAANVKVKPNTVIVQELQSIINHNPQIKIVLIQALNHAPQSSYWYHKTPNDFYRFFNEWLTYAPDALHGFKYVHPYNQFVYGKYGQRFIHLPKMSAWLTRFFQKRGQYIDSPQSKKHLQGWLNDPRINIKQYIIPEGGYKSFNQFFYRQLKPNQRNIDAPTNNTIIDSPNDGSMTVVFPAVKDNSTIKVKGESLHIRGIFNNNPIADKFIGGPVLLSSLGVYDYHHYHAPVAGKVIMSQGFSGFYDDDTDLSGLYGNLYQHRRGVYIFKNSCVGYVGMVPVGYWMVGSVNLSQKKGDIVTKGEDMGHFAYGGSAILLFFEPDRIQLVPDLVQNGNYAVLIGQRIATVTQGCNNQKNSTTK